MTSKNQVLLGAHISISKGFSQAIHDAESIGCTAMQIFLHSNRQWTMRDLDQERITEFITTAAKSSIRAYAVHASYLLNLGSSNVELRSKSITMLTKELTQCEQLKIPFLIIHPGSATNTTVATCMYNIIDGVARALDAAPGKTMLLVENTAGQGLSVGHTLEQLNEILEGISHPKRVGTCFDTCHGFAAGYDFTSPPSYKSFWKQFDHIIGIENLKLFHLNDSKKPLGSHLDRHENIGGGKIGLEAFRLLMNDKQFVDIPKILETPYDLQTGLITYAHEIKSLRALIK